jgi:hypothetical protein
LYVAVLNDDGRAWNTFLTNCNQREERERERERERDRDRERRETMVLYDVVVKTIERRLLSCQV